MAALFLIILSAFLVVLFYTRRVRAHAAALEFADIQARASQRLGIKPAQTAAEAPRRRMSADRGADCYDWRV